MQFKVPQFLDIEDKIFGPFTFKQFVYLAGGAGLSFIIYKLLGFFLGFIPIALVAALALALAFYKPNKKPLLNMMEAGFKFYVQDKLYVWKRRIQKKEKTEKNDIIQNEDKINYHPKNLTQSKLKDLAWSLDVLDLKKEE
jgi:hypothetical protein